MISTGKTSRRGTEAPISEKENDQRQKRTAEASEKLGARQKRKDLRAEL